MWTKLFNTKTFSRVAIHWIVIKKINFIISRALFLDPEINYNHWQTIESEYNAHRDFDGYRKKVRIIHG